LSVVALVVILSSLDFNRLKPFLAQAVKQETGRNLDIRGRIELKLGLRPSLVVEDIVFQNGLRGTAPEMLTIKRLEAGVLILPLLNKEIQITRLLLLEPSLLIERDKSGKWNVEFEKPESAPQKELVPQSFALSKLGFRQVQVEKGRVSFRDGDKGTICRLSIDRFIASSEGMESPIALAFSGSYNDQPVELGGTVGSFLLLRDTARGYPVDLTARAGGAQWKTEGTIRDVRNMKGFALKADAEVPSTVQAAAFFGEVLSAELGPLQMSFALSDGADGSYRFADLKIASKAGDAGGMLTLNLGEGRPKLSGSLSSRILRLTPFLSGDKANPVKSQPGTEKSRVFPNDPLRLEIFRYIDLHLKYSAEQVQLPRLPLANLNLEANLKDGRLDLRPIRAKAAGGDAEGEVEVKPQGRVAFVKAGFKITQLDLSQVSAELKAEGKVDAELDLLSKGSSVAGFMASLNGGTVAIMGRGRVDNKSIQLLGGDLAGGIFQLFNPSSKAANHTDINCAVSGLDIKDGIARVTALVVDTPDMTVVGEGEVNLEDETLNLGLKPHEKGGAGVSLSLAELAKSFRLGGTLANPSLKIDAAQTMLTAGKAAGGVLLFGPAGIAAALAGKSSGDVDPCLTAAESAKKGMKSSESAKGAEQKAKEEKGVSGTLKSLEESVKKLFGGQGKPPASDNRSGPLGGGGP
jgi:uncharacterized protein involved in outer membrane biogenesis